MSWRKALIDSIGKRRSTADSDDEPAVRASESLFHNGKKWLLAERRSPNEGSNTRAAQRNRFEKPTLNGDGEVNYER